MVAIMKSPLTNKPVASITPERSGNGVAAPTVETGESVEALNVFATVHKSNNFSLNIAHQLFAGVRRSTQ